MTSARPQRSLAALLLVQQLVVTPAAPLRPAEYWALLERVPDPAVLLGLGAEQVARTAGVEPSQGERLARRLDAATALAFRLDEAEQSGLRLLVSVDPGYPRALPERLGRAAPPLLSVAGDPGLLSSGLLGVVGSRAATEVGVRVARVVAAEAAARGLGVVSGAARGVDRAAMTSALESGGCAVGVLAGSLVQATQDAGVRRAVTAGRLCLCTADPPAAPFGAAAAMRRNKLVYALSRATLVVAADAGVGGTWAGALEALRQRTASVLAWSAAGGGAGNRLLVERGALPVARVSEVFEVPAWRR